MTERFVGAALGVGLVVQVLAASGTLGEHTAAATAVGAGAAGIGLGALARRSFTRRPDPDDDVQRANAVLEARVRERTARLEAMKGDLDQLAYVASHDLQEPLRTIEGLAHTLRRRLGGQVDPESAEMLGFLEDAAKRGRTMVREVLRYAAAGGDPTWEPVDPRGLLEAALAQLAAARAEVTWDALPAVSGTPHLLAQVFQNLLANAFRYGGAPPVRVHVSAARGPGCDPNPSVDMLGRHATARRHAA